MNEQPQPTQSIEEDAGIYDKNLGFKTDVVVTQQTLGNFIALCRDERPSIERLLEISLRRDLATKATRQLNGFLSLVGLSVKKPGHRKDGESKIYLYELAGDGWTLLAPSEQ